MSTIETDRNNRPIVPNAYDASGSPGSVTPKVTTPQYAPVTAPDTAEVMHFDAPAGNAQQGNYNSNTPLNTVLPNDPGGSGEGSLSGGAGVWLTVVGSEDPAASLLPRIVAADGSSSPDTSDVSNDDVFARRVVQEAVARAATLSKQDDIDTNPASTNSDDSASSHEQEQQLLNKAQQKAREEGRINPDGTRMDENEQPSAARNAAANVDKLTASANVVSELNGLLTQQLGLQAGKIGAQAAALMAEPALALVTEGVLAQLVPRGEGMLADAPPGAFGNLAAARMDDVRSGLMTRGDGPLVPGQAGPGAAQVDSRVLLMMMSNMPAPGTTQPVLAMIAADIFRLQTARLELMASSRGVDEDGEMPPIDEDEAAMKRREVAGIDLGGMWRWDLRPR